MGPIWALLKYNSPQPLKILVNGIRPFFLPSHCVLPFPSNGGTSKTRHCFNESIGKKLIRIQRDLRFYRYEETQIRLQSPHFDGDLHFTSPDRR